jgi:hypothetical protein
LKKIQDGERFGFTGFFWGNGVVKTWFFAVKRVVKDGFGMVNAATVMLRLAERPAAKIASSSPQGSGSCY